MAQAGDSGGEGILDVRAVQTRRRAARWLPVLLCMVVIFFLSAQQDLPHHPDALVDLVVKKLGHMAEYGTLAVLALWAGGSSSSSTPRSHFVWAFALAALYAASDELHQRFVPGRGSQLLDVGFDVAGAALALWVMSKVQRARQRSKGIDSGC